MSGMLKVLDISAKMSVSKQHGKSSVYIRSVQKFWRFWKKLSVSNLHALSGGYFNECFQPSCLERFWLKIGVKLSAINLHAKNGGYVRSAQIFREFGNKIDCFQPAFHEWLMCLSGGDKVGQWE